MVRPSLIQTCNLFPNLIVFSITKASVGAPLQALPSNYVKISFYEDYRMVTELHRHIVNPAEALIVGELKDFLLGLTVQQASSYVERQAACDQGFRVDWNLCRFWKCDQLVVLKLDVV